MIRAMVFLWLAGLSLFDIRYKRVPLWLVLAGGVLVAGAGVYGCVSGEYCFTECLAGMVPGAVLLLLAAGTRKAGWADGVVLIILGIILGFWKCIMVAMLSLVLISVLSALLLIFRRAGKGTLIPYVPFLTLGLAFCEMVKS